jgi:hypothetical protein
MPQNATVMIPTISIRSLHLEYRLWVNELNFYKEEIKIFERQLETLVIKNPLDELSAKFEQFQNKFILQKEIIDHLKHDLNISEKQLATFVHELSGMGLENIKMDNHTRLRERMATFRKLYTEMKNDFKSFEAEWY